MHNLNKQCIRIYRNETLAPNFRSWFRIRIDKVERETNKMRTMIKLSLFSDKVRYMIQTKRKQEMCELLFTARSLSDSWAYASEGIILRSGPFSIETVVNCEPKINLSERHCPNELPVSHSTIIMHFSRHPEYMLTQYIHLSALILLRAVLRLLLIAWLTA